MHLSPHSGALEATKVDLSSHVNDYRQKRDFICAALSDHYEISKPNGAFMFTLKLPVSGEKFVNVTAENLLISSEIYLAVETLIFESASQPPMTLQRVEVLKRLARS